MKCVYSGNIIDSLDDLEIDHIIPKSIPAEELTERKEKYNLSKDFSIDSLENLLPTFKRYNRLKWKRPFEEFTERFFIHIAKSKKSDIENELIEFSKRLEKFENVSMKIAFNEKFEFKSKKSFKVKREVLNQDDLYMKHHYWNSKQNVCLTGYLPSKYDEKGSFSIEFKDLATMISLTHSGIIELIKIRKYSSIKDAIFRGSSYGKTKSFISIGTNAVHLENELFRDFIEILDDYLNEYEKYYLDFQKFIGVTGYKKVKDSDSYILLETTRDNWNKLIDYSKEYDLDNGKEEKYCFDYNKDTITALDKNYNSIKFRLIPSQVEDNPYHTFKYPDNSMNILWRIPLTQDRVRIKSGEVWTFEKTLNWVNKIIK